MARLALSLLGPFQATLDGQPLSGLVSDKVRALLAYLAVESERAHPREALADLLWPEFAPDAARANLRNSLANLRAALRDRGGRGRDQSPPFLVSTSETIAFERGSDHALDVAEFEAILAGERAPDKLERAVALYRGDLLSGFSLRDAAPFEDWLLLARERLRRQYLEALQRLVAAREERGEPEAALAGARQWVESDPWDEAGQRALMRLLTLAGQRSAALAQYDKCGQALQRELGVQPGAATVELYQQIRDGRLAEREARPAPSAAPRLSEPRLPMPLLPLIGREAELAEILARLREPDSRLVSLIGPGGIGKSRLALEAARQVEGEFAQGAYFIPLAAVETVEGLIPAIAQGAGMGFYQGSSAPKQQLLERLRGREALLLLDNCEQLLAGAELISEILEAAPHVRVLATTRARLGLLGEECMTLGGLEYESGGDGQSPVPNPQSAIHNPTSPPPAIRLFIEGARRARPRYAPSGDDLASIAQVCRWVEGMPLAILLAASWMELLSPAEIASQMAGADGQRLDLLAAEFRDLPERQRSMRAVFDHSWRLLTAREQETLAALSLFRGRFTLEGAREVGGASPRDLLHLVDRSLLLRSAEGAYYLHDLLRRYAAEKLAGSPDGLAAARDRHAAYYARAAEIWRAEIAGARQDQAVRETVAAWADLRAAWEWALARGLIEQISPLMHIVRGVCGLLARWAEADAWFRGSAERWRALGLPRSGPNLFAQAALISTEVFFAGYVGRAVQDSALLEECLALLDEAERAGQPIGGLRAVIWRQLGDLDRCLAEARAAGNRQEEANAIHFSASRARLEGRLAEAHRLYEQFLPLARELGMPNVIRQVLASLSALALYEGQLAEAEAHARELEALCAATVEPLALAMHRRALVQALLRIGRFAEARALAAENARFWQELGDRAAQVADLCALAESATLLGDYAAAGPALAQAVAIIAELGSAAPAWGGAFGLGALRALAEGQLVEAERWADRCLAAYRQVGGDHCFWAEVVRGHLSLALGRLEEARRAWRGALAGYYRSGLGSGNAWEWASGVALYLARSGQRERAVELYALALKQPLVARSRWHEDVCGRAIAEAAASLPPEVVRAAEERGRARDLAATMQELLAELGT